MPLTDAQVDKLRAEAGVHLDSDETIVAAADAQSAPGWAALLRGLLWIVGLVASWFIFPRWRLLVTDRRILALRKHPLLPGRFTGGAVSYPLQDLEIVRLEGRRGKKIVLVGAATGGEEISYGSVRGFKPSEAEFEETIVCTRELAELRKLDPEAAERIIKEIDSGRAGMSDLRTLVFRARQDAVSVEKAEARLSAEGRLPPPEHPSTEEG